MVFAYVSIQGWIIDRYEHWFFNQPGEILLFPAHYAKFVKCGSMTCGVTVVMNRGGGFQMFFKPLFKCSSCLSYVLLITFQPITFESIYYATLFCYVVLCVRMKLKTSTQKTTRNSNKDSKPICKSYIDVPYNEGLSESFKNICKRYGIQVHFKSGKTIKKMNWWHQKIKTT